MFAVIQTGGKQYRVAEHDVIRVEKLPGEAGESVELGEVLMLGNGADAQVGAPLVEGARVVATILEQARAPKILVFKKKRRKNYRRTRGHRQDLTILRVTDILSAGGKPKKIAAKAAPAPVEAKPTKPAKAAPKKAEKPSATAAPKKAEKAPTKAKTTPKTAEKAPAKAKAAPKKADKAPAKAKAAPKKAAATKAPAKAKTAAKPKPKAKSGKGSGKEKA